MMNCLEEKQTILYYFLSILLKQVVIPEQDTTYWCQMFKIPILHEKHHVIKVCDLASDAYRTFYSKFHFIHDVTNT